MYAQDLVETRVGFDDILLDPNNPRFWSEQSHQEVPDRRIPLEAVQGRAAAAISKYGIEELYDSILRNGFLPLDRIVVRAIDGHPGKYVVVEGNRRVAALRLLRTRIAEGTIVDEHVDDAYLMGLQRQTDELVVLVYQGTEGRDISWLLQGIRHLSGIRDWAPAQRGRLLANQIDGEGLSFRQAGQTFGLTAQAVGRLYRSYKALEQMQGDDEYQGKAKNEYFTLFEEAIRNSQVKNWLDWSDEERKFRNEDNLRQFYAWITPDDENDNARRIHDPRQIKKLGTLISGGHEELLGQIDDHTLSIDEGYERATREDRPADWKGALLRVERLLDGIPQSVIRAHPGEIADRLAKIQMSIDETILMARAVLGAGN